MAFGNKNSTPSFALTLPMKVTEQDEIFLSKKVSHRMYGLQPNGYENHKNVASAAQNT